MSKTVLEQAYSRKLTGLLAALSAAVLLAACDSTPPAVTYGASAPTGAKLNLPVPNPGVLDTAKWPNSCDLLTDAEVGAILPQASNITHKPAKVSFYTAPGVSPNGKLTYTAPPADVPAGECNLWFHLPEKWDGQNSNIDIVMRAIADPASITAFYQKERTADRTATDLGPVGGATTCYLTTLNAMHCAYGHYYFELSGRSTPVDGSTTGNPIWREKVLSQVIHTLTYKMS
ncbi:hypothetical protein ACFVUS_16840 [Nocardia sp. NPDC058058]|uniref:hypothetical protein n=1 Tax=Nocardia sp. NPDC058058 TaxID=3346317 RepID=UPI0036DE870E